METGLNTEPDARRAAALPTTFATADEAARLVQMLELDLEQVQEIAGGRVPICCVRLRCCAY